MDILKIGFNMKYEGNWSAFPLSAIFKNPSEKSIF